MDPLATTVRPRRQRILLLPATKQAPPDFSAGPVVLRAAESSLPVAQSRLREAQGARSVQGQPEVQERPAERPEAWERPAERPEAWERPEVQPVAQERPEAQEACTGAPQEAQGVRSPMRHTRALGLR